MLTRDTKKENIDRFSSRIKDAKVIIIAENLGLTVSDISSLREKIKKDEGSNSVQVVKNTLASIAVKDTQFNALSNKLSGALIYGVGEDPADIAKHFIETAKKNNKLAIRGAVLANSDFLDESAVKILAELPSKEQLLAQLAGTLQMPITQFVRILSAIPTGCVRVLAAYRDTKN